MGAPAPNIYGAPTTSVPVKKYEAIDEGAARGKGRRHGVESDEQKRSFTC